MGDLNDDELETETETATDAGAPAPAKTTTLPTASIGNIRREGRRQGFREAQANLEAQAHEAGFDTWEEMVAAAKAHNQRVAAANPRLAGSTRAAPATSSRRAEPAQNVEDEEASPPARTGLARRRALEVQQEHERLTAEYNRQNALRAKAVQENRRLTREIEVARTEATLRVQAVRAGITDDSVDFAIDRLRREIKLKTAAEVAAFDTAKFFTIDLRKKIPALYAVQEQPLHTGAESEGAETTGETAPRTSTPTPKITPGRDARTMSAADVAKRLHDLGLEAN